MRELHLQTLKKAIKGINPMINLKATSLPILALSRDGILLSSFLQLLIISMAGTHLMILDSLGDKISGVMPGRTNSWDLTEEQH